MKQFLSISLLLFILTGCAEYDVENEGVFYSYVDHNLNGVKKPLEGADPETFEVMDNDDYGKDLHSVFYKGERIPGADASSFEFVGDLFAKDKFRVFYAGDSIHASSSRGFRIIDSYYSADHKDIYWTTEPLHVCSTNDFELIPLDSNEHEFERWATDGCWYYLRHFKIPSDDYANVHLYRGSAGFAKDRNWVYHLDRKINFIDGERILDTVDVATFTVSRYIECKDKFGCINPYHGREPCDP
ncbi:MAG: DKNYY domain-containing protein [Flavobacteriales bacterium]|nr:DKNYY domain-containing protein [Flavobacteriales bacterium]